MKKYKYRKWFVFNHKKYSVYGDTLEEVYSKKALKLNALEKNEILISSEMKVKDWTEKALSIYKINLQERSIKNSEYRYEKYIYPVIGSMSISKVKSIQCQEILNSLSNKSSSTIKKVYQELNFIFTTALKNDLINKNPVDGIIVPKGYKNSRTAISTEERKALLKAFSQDHTYILFILMLECGCRPSEAINLIGSDIQQMNGVNVLHIRGTKTKNSDRYVPIPDELYELIQDTPPDRPIALNRAGRKHNRESYIRAYNHLRRDMNILMGCKMYRNKLQPPYPLRESFVPYDLRHTYCTDLAEKGVDIRIAQKLMGHSSISITSAIYTHISNELSIKRASEILNKKN